MKDIKKYCKGNKNKKVCKWLNRLCPKGYEIYPKAEFGQVNGIPLVSTTLVAKCKH